jgi:hypothetical protein
MQPTKQIEPVCAQGQATAPDLGQLPAARLDQDLLLAASKASQPTRSICSSRICDQFVNATMSAAESELAAAALACWAPG